MRVQQINNYNKFLSHAILFTNFPHNNASFSDFGCNIKKRLFIVIHTNEIRKQYI